MARLLVWTVIAIALCVIAFGRGTDASDALTPEVGGEQATVKVSKADIRSVIKLVGTVNADPAVKLKATSSGTVSRVRVSAHDAVAVGTPLFDVIVTLTPTTSTSTHPDGTQTTIEKPRTRTDTVKSTAAGTLAELDVLKGQEVAVGADVASVDPGTLTVKAPLTQTQQFRLLKPPAAAEVQAQGGPAPFTCTGLTMSAAPQGDPGTSPQQSFDPYATSSGSGPTTAEISCPVPGGATVFAGMSVDLTVDTGSVAGVLAVPASAVQGSVGSGNVWVLGPNGTPMQKKVSLGLTDGTLVQVTSGLAEGDEVLEFAPVDGKTPSAAPATGPAG